MAKKVKIGDVFRVKVTGGYGYIQYVKRDDEYGYLIRKFGLVYNGKEDFEEVSRICLLKTDFYIFYPLQSAFNASEKGETTDDGNMMELNLIRGINVPDMDVNPIMLEWQDGYWSVRQDNVSIYIGKKLNENHKGLSKAGIINHKMLLHRIETGYKTIQKD